MINNCIIMATIGPIPQFLQKIASNWDISLVYPKIWAVCFTPAVGATDALCDSIEKNLLHFDDINNFTGFVNKSFNPYLSLLRAPQNVSVSLPSAEHFLLASKLSIPGENLTLSSPSIPSNSMIGGVLRGRAVNGLQQSVTERVVTITFLNTNKEFTEFVIRPWLVAVAHRGLVETRHLPSLKCDIVTFFYAKSSPNAKTMGRVLGQGELLQNSFLPNQLVHAARFTEDAPHLRKKVTFKNCVPVSVPTASFNYSNDISSSELMTDIRFSYDYYEIENMETTTTSSTVINTGLNVGTTGIITDNDNESNEFTK